MSEQQFLAALREQLIALGGNKVWRRIAVAVRAAAAEPGGKPSSSAPPSPARTG